GPGDVQTYREHIWRRAEYEALFDAAQPGTLRGESTPFYLYRQDAQDRIRALIPNAKLIVILRDPVERAHSNWTHLWSAGLDPIGDFPAACAAEDHRVAAGWAPFWHYTRLGRYGEQLDHLFGLFPREQVFLLRYRDLVGSPAPLLHPLPPFPRLPPAILPPGPPHRARPPTPRAVPGVRRPPAPAGRHLPGTPGPAPPRPPERFLQRSPRPRQPLTWEQRQQVLAYVEDDFRLLAKITGADFADW